LAGKAKAGMVMLNYMGEYCDFGRAWCRYGTDAGVM